MKNVSHMGWIFLVLLLILSGFFLFRVNNIISPFIAGVALAYTIEPACHLVGEKRAQPPGSSCRYFYLDHCPVVPYLFLLLPKLYMELGKLAPACRSGTGDL